jgi:hypothetical protein
MFKLIKKEEVSWPVVVNIPVDGGAVRKHSFEARFKLLDTAQAKAAMEEHPAAGDDEAPEADFLHQVLTGWDKVSDESGAPLPFNAENKATLLRITYVRTALFDAYFQASTGNAAARKN